MVRSQPQPRWFVARTAAFLCLTMVSIEATWAQDELPLTFEKDIRPILRAHCFDCHGATDEKQGELDLRQARRMILGGEGGPAIEPGMADESLLVERLRYAEMPPGSSKVPDDEIAIIERWINQGAPTARPEAEEIPDGIGLSAEERGYWFFQPLQKPAPPQLVDSRIRNDIDRFVLARLQENQLDWSPAADRRTLALRLYFDLIGLPPSRDDLESFLFDPDPAAYEKLVDRLLESQHYGERWGRHWLDVAGYADSEGFTNADTVRPWAYFYRDYVIRSLNADKPLDQFLLEQLAGDEWVPGPHTNLSPDQIEKLVATGYLRMAADGTGQRAVDEAAARNQTVADTIKIVSTGLMGLSVACAQCHDHRYDPVLQEDYYRLRAVLEPALDWNAWKTPAQRRVSLYTDDDRRRAAEIEAEAQKVQQEKNSKQTVYMAEALNKELEKFDEPLRGQLRAAYETPGGERTPEQKALLKMHPSVNISPGVLYQYNQAAADELKEFDKRIGEIRATKPPERFIRVLVEPSDHLPETKLFHRGDHRQPTRIVQPGELTVLFPENERADIPINDPSRGSTGRRTALARTLTSGRHTLFNRVMANRVWMHHFGRGIVGSPSDFGRLGEQPSDPELLDWLACELADNGWSLKSLHRMIVTSTTYRQRSSHNETFAAIDQDNRWLWRYPVRRLEAEIIRDRILATSGELASDMFGPAVGIKEDDSGQVVASSDTRRSIYLQVRRTKPLAFLQAFDAPIMETNCERRVHSTVAPQSLMLLNSQFLLTQARKFAARVALEAEQAISDEQLGAVDIQVPAPANPWDYGYGTEEEGVFDFAPLPHWNGSRWQGGADLPDATLNWCMLYAQGGHPGDTLAAIRRWTAAGDGVLNISGQLTHSSDKGNGVRARIYSSRHGQLGDFVMQNGNTETPVEQVLVQAGDTISFVVDSRGDVGFDGFQWPVTLQLAGATTGRWQSARDFAGPAGAAIEKQVVYAWWLAYQRPPDQQEFNRVMTWLTRQMLVDKQAENPSAALNQAMVGLCQSLLGSNEFLYVD